MSARSMTGFARVRRSLSGVDAVLTVKSVNHRGLDVHFHMPPVLDPFEPLARAVIKKRVDRGHIQIHAALERQAAIPSGRTEMLVDSAALERWTLAYRAVADALGSAREPDPHDALRAPGVLQSESVTEWGPELEQTLRDCFEQVLEEWNEFREREGEAIVAEMRGRAQRVHELGREMEAIRATATRAFHDRLVERMGDLLGAHSIEPQRLIQEAAILAERSDISEETMRLKTHAGQLLIQLEAPGEKGKKLDFLLQEMNRESNTVLAKTSGLGDHGLTLTDLALAAKAEIDKMREQSLNLE